jgi:hypothetical protein
MPFLMLAAHAQERKNEKAEPKSEKKSDPNEKKELLALKKKGVKR